MTAATCAKGGSLPTASPSLPNNAQTANCNHKLQTDGLYACHSWLNSVHPRCIQEYRYFKTFEISLSSNVTAISTNPQPTAIFLVWYSTGFVYYNEQYSHLVHDATVTRH